MAWFILVFAGMLEVVGAVALKFAHGFTHIGYTTLVVAAFAASFLLLATAVETLPIGTAYAIWTGIGSAGVALFGMLWLGESRRAARIASLTLVVAGSVGMKAFG